MQSLSRVDGRLCVRVCVCRHALYNDQQCVPPILRWFQLHSKPLPWAATPLSIHSYPNQHPPLWGPKARVTTVFFLFSRSISFSSSFPSDHFTMATWPTEFGPISSTPAPEILQSGPHLLLLFMCHPRGPWLPIVIGVALVYQIFLPNFTLFFHNHHTVLVTSPLMERKRMYFTNNYQYFHSLYLFFSVPRGFEGLDRCLV